MGCNCKNKEKVKEPILVQTKNGETEILDYHKPSYTIENLIRMKDYTSSTNRTEEERLFIYNILYHTFGDIIPDYCDIPCINHIKNRIRYMETELTKYDVFTKMKR